jgi:hypothetical protein
VVRFHPGPLKTRVTEQNGLVTRVRRASDAGNVHAVLSPVLSPNLAGRLDLQEADERLAAAAATEETEQSKDDDHNQDDHKNAEDATSFSRSRSVG